MGKRLSQLNQIDEASLSQEDYLLVDGENYLESKKIKLKDINLNRFNTSGFYNKEQAEDVFVKKEKGKTLTSNDFTDAYKLKVEGSQERLVSGENIKTINNQSILGEGNIDTLPNSYINNTFSNALKGKKVGKIVTVNDVSPIEHDLKVKLSSDTITDFSSVSVTRCGKNLFDGSIQIGFGLSGTGNNRTVISGTSGYKIIKVKPNTTYCFSGDFSAAKDNVIRFASFTEYPIENSVSNKFGSTGGSNRVFTTTANDNYLFIWFVVPQKTTDIAMQIEEGKIATEYEQYNGQIVTANADGTVEGITSLSPNMTLLTDTDGVNIDLEYNRDINKPLQFEKVYEGIVQNVDFDKTYTEIYFDLTTMNGSGDVGFKLDNNNIMSFYHNGVDEHRYYAKFDGGIGTIYLIDRSAIVDSNGFTVDLTANGIIGFLVALENIDETQDYLKIYAR